MRSEINIFELNRLKMSVDNCCDADRVATNHYYGHAYEIKSYAGIDENAFLNCTIEHGINITTELAFSREIMHNNNLLLTYSKYRENIYSKYSDKNAVSIGPYIAYTESYYSLEEFARTKSKLGKVLLFFPGHSTFGTEIDYDSAEMIERLDDAARNFDTVMVCMYYYDLILKRDTIFRKKGYKVVSAGYMTDRYFLSRLRTILELSDAVVCNAFVSGIAYALYLDKPVCMVRQQYEYKTVYVDDNSIGFPIGKTRLEELYEVCKSTKFDNLNEQKEVNNYVFGLDCVKSAEELRAILDEVVRY